MIRRSALARSFFSESRRESLRTVEVIFGV